MYNIPIMIITNTQHLESVCQRFATFPYMTIDTEFIREKTFYPEVCLIQIASPEEAFCIDPLSEDINLKPLFDLLQNTNVVKVFHAASQDLEILYHLTGKIPSPIFDTQIGAMACGYGENVGYQQLVKSIVKIDLDKSMRCTNWSKRPLTEKQIEYALCDVTHLRRIYTQLKEDLAKLNREAWIEEELQELNDVSTYAHSPEKLLKKTNHLNFKGVKLSVFQQLIIYRDKIARSKNKPRRHLIKDDLLQELAAVTPTTPEQLKTLRNTTNGFEKSSIANDCLKIIENTLQNNTPPLYIPANNKALTSSQKNLVEILKLALQLTALNESVAPSLIASMGDLEYFAQNRPCSFDKGWRFDIFGQKAAQIKNGETCLIYHPRSKKVKLLNIKELNI